MTASYLPFRSCLWRLAVIGFLAMSGLGCQRTGNVAGKVSYQNKPVVFGTIMVVASDGNIHQASIREDGSYSVQGVRVGEARIAVNSSDPTAPLVTKPGQMGANPEENQRRADLRTKWFPLPKDLGDPNKSGLKVQVKGGDNNHNIPLK
jgi:hypothetical protein